ncbi:MAG: hypothetical protein NTX22_01600 [Ignavibacteriales bacterium]|nr:hypothetical protein [Ignavibacteriales bacterium]
MSDNEKNKLSMYQTVISYLNENRDIISTNRSFYYAISKLRKAMDEIKVRDKELSSDALEKTITTYNAKDELLFSLVPITTALFTFARESGNIELKEKTRISHSHLIRLRDSELANKAFAILQYAMSNLSKLNKYGVLKSTLQELNLKIESFRDALDSKIITFVSSTAALSLNASFQEAENILNNQLDKLVEPLNLEYEEFYDDYLSIRAMESFEETEEDDLILEGQD